MQSLGVEAESGVVTFVHELFMKQVGRTSVTYKNTLKSFYPQVKKRKPVWV